MLRFAAILLLLTGCSSLVDREQSCGLNNQSVISSLRNCDKVWVTAHRGVIPGFPDNSLSGMKAAIEAKVDFLEVDVRFLADKELVLFHDATFDGRNATVKSELLGRRVDSINLAEWRTVKLVGTEERPPTFGEGLELVKGTRSALELDLKNENQELVEAVFTELEARQMLNFTIIQFNEIELYKEFKKRYPGVAMILKVKAPEALEHAIALQPEVVELVKWLTEDALDKTKRAGIKVLKNVSSRDQDNAAGWRELRQQGVSLIMTDRADEAVRAVGNR